MRAEVADERFLGAERQPPHARVEPVGAHDQVGAARLAAVEADLDAVVAQHVGWHAGQPLVGGVDIGPAAQFVRALTG